MSSQDVVRQRNAVHAHEFQVFSAFDLWRNFPAARYSWCIHRLRPTPDPMSPKSMILCAALLAAAFVAFASCRTAPVGGGAVRTDHARVSRCLTPAQRRHVAASGKVVPLSKAIRAARARQDRRGRRQALQEPKRSGLPADSARAGWQSHPRRRRCREREALGRRLIRRAFRLASPRHRGRSRPQPPARNRADRRRLCRRSRVRRRGGALSRRDRAL